MASTEEAQPFMAWKNATNKNKIKQDLFRAAFIFIKKKHPTHVLQS